MQVLWLRYLTEIEERTKEVPQELLENPEINKALTIVEESAYSDAQMLAYDKFWDIIRTERTFYNSAHREGFKEGRDAGIEAGLKEGMEKGMEKGMNQRSFEIARKMLANGMDAATVMEITGLSAEEILLLKREK